MLNYEDNTKHINTGLTEKYSRFFSVLFSLMLFFGVNISYPSFSGDGLKIPSNTGAWLFLSAIILLSFIKIIKTKSIVISKLLIPLFLTLFTLLIIGVFKSEVGNRELIMRVLEISGFFLVFFSLSQFRFTKKRTTQLLYIIVLAAFFQVLYALAQLHHDFIGSPDYLFNFIRRDGLPVGGLRQINMISMFLATSSVIAILLSSADDFKHRGIIIKLGIFMFLLGSGYIISVIGSRATFVSLPISLLLALFYWTKFSEKKNYWTIFMVITLISSILFTITLKKENNRDVLRQGQSRVLIWSLTVDAIKEKPILGYGLGGFTKAYHDAYEEYASNLEHKVTKKTPFVTHPHNELLYWWVEGGIFSVISILMAIIYYILVLFRQNLKRTVKYATLLFPISLHTIVSLPFYLSTLLMFLFLFLLNKSIEKPLKIIHFSLKSFYLHSLLFFCSFLFVSYVWFLKEVVNGSTELVEYENAKIKNPDFVINEFNNPYWGNVVKSFLYNNHMHYEYKRGNLELAEKYLDWLEEQLSRTEEPINYQLVLSGRLLLNKKNAYNGLMKKFRNRYPGHFMDLPDSI